MFVEVVFAPGYDDDAIEVLTQKPNIRILDNQERRRVPLGEHDIKRVRGGILVQDRDSESELREEMSVATECRPTEEQWGELLFAWRVCKHVRSNAIVFSKDLATLGVGAGQMSRVDSVRIAVEKAQSSLDGAVMASDAFFPFADAAQVAIAAGITAVIQPGGSNNDAEVIEACETARVPMVFTSRRHFRH
jgi:phosphoribosylaminoimidazolecarboxamide formyltransferase/IMP cyclohydrolase